MEKRSVNKGLKICVAMQIFNQGMNDIELQLLRISGYSDTRRGVDKRCFNIMNAS